MHQIKNRILAAFVCCYLNYILLGCTTENASLHYNMQADTLRVSMPVELIGPYTAKSIYQTTEGNELLFMYNRFMHEIDVINLTELKFFKTIQLEKQGPDKVDMSSFCVLNQDSIVTISNSVVYLFNWEGKVLNKKSLTNDFTTVGVYIGNGYLPSKNAIPLQYILSNNTVFDAVQHSSSGALLYLDTYKIDSLFNFYPFNVKEVNYGAFSYPKFTVANHKIYAVFPFSSSIYILSDGSAQKLNPIHEPEKLVKANPHHFTDIIGSINYAATSAHYSALLFDPAKEYTYQVFNNKVEEMGQVRSYDLNVRNKDWELVYTFQLPSDILFPICSKLGLLCLLSEESQKPYELRFIRFTLERI